MFDVPPNLIRMRCARLVARVLGEFSLAFINELKTVPASHA
jgi:hypothetical protein